MASQPIRRSERLLYRQAYDAEERQLPHLVTSVRPSSFDQRPLTVTAQDEEVLMGHNQRDEHELVLPTSIVSYYDDASTACEVESDHDMERPLEDALSHVLSVASMVIPYDVRRPLFGVAWRSTTSMSINSHSIGLFSFCCRACHALHWKDEEASRQPALHTFLLCCHHGKVMLPFLQQPPEPLYDFYIGNTAQARSFQQNLVQYNAALAFTSLGVSPDNAVNLQPGPPVFRVHGELMHWSGCLQSDANSAASYAQLYIYDSQQALMFRMNRNPNLDEMTMAGLQAMMDAYNPYVDLYMRAYEILHDSDAPDYTACLITLPGNDARQNELPTADEVAVILPNSAQQVDSSSRDIILILRHPLSSSPLQRISEGHAAYAPTHYVLLFPYGESGWHWDINQAGSSSSSQV
ncbi:hypothetical protein AGABI1DRAFT_131993 [Agaricus bisporus var. burnettii JB137-S8]|uniref:Helitron helicase-like domain-containing protein n=1 Tax=Agaricus bisporus var. burnettii (strain JB137-S8 / ATCC MYA-4627 / FGSC 10392) TaxID=597362 RepID=K5WYS5_AGABU|nr:uncharacterized protein AGABI1DRAFT_131993 [Agaricus bisporus var. burnettii JB137-S8]EKM75762.1 hypothetical protein AGABI1DRAFT_131993 [Agaricus bisporus var. burnettii JB137-S8]